MRSSSLLFKDMRASPPVSTDVSGCGLEEFPTELIPATPTGFFPVATVSSTIVFHSPHDGHRPIHLGLSFPHDVQNQAVFIFVAISSNFYYIDRKYKQKKDIVPFRDNIFEASEDAFAVECQITRQRLCCRRLCRLNQQQRSMNRSTLFLLPLLPQPSSDCCCRRKTR